MHNNNIRTTTTFSHFNHTIAAMMPESATSSSGLLNHFRWKRLWISRVQLQLRECRLEGVHCIVQQRIDDAGGLPNLQVALCRWRSHAAIVKWRSNIMNTSSLLSLVHSPFSVSVANGVACTRPDRIVLSTLRCTCDYSSSYNAAEAFSSSTQVGRLGWDDRVDLSHSIILRGICELIKPV
jgi:hypothetical protein